MHSFFFTFSTAQKIEICYNFEDIKAALCLGAVMHVTRYLLLHRMIMEGSAFFVFSKGNRNHAAQRDRGAAAAETEKNGFLLL